MKADKIKNCLRNMRVLCTHLNPDIDALVSMFLLWNAAGRPQGLQYHFVPSGEGGATSFERGWFVVDTGQGLFDHHQPGSKHSCAAAAVFSWLRPFYSREDRYVSKLFVRYAEAQDTGRIRELHTKDKSLYPVAEAFSFASLQQAVLYSPLEEYYDDTEEYNRIVSEKTVNTLLPILAYFYDRKKGHYQSHKKLVNKEEWEDKDGSVVLLKDGDKRYNKLEEKKGRSLIVFYKSDRTTVGIYRTSVGSHIDLAGFYRSGRFRRLFDISEGRENWFCHNSGYLLVWNEHKARGCGWVNPQRLADAVSTWLKYDCC